MAIYNNLRKITLYFFTKGTSDGLLAVRGLILAHFLGPEAFGGWVLFRLATNYVGFADLGVPRGLEFFVAREAERDTPALVSYWRSALGFILLLFGVISLVLIMASFYVADHALASGMRWFSAAILTEQLWLLGLSYLRAKGNLRSFAVYEVTNAALHVVFSICLAPVWGLTGAFASFLLASALSLGILSRPLPKRPALSKARLRAMLKMGLPILVSLLIGFSLASADRLIVAGNGDMALLGLYGFAFNIAGLAGSLAQVIRIVVYPDVYAKVAALGNARALEDHLKGTLLPFARLIPPVLGLFALLIGPLVSTILPQYVDAIPAATILIFAGATAGFERLGALGVIAAQEQKMLPIFSGCALFINLTFSFLALRFGYGLQGVAGAAVFSNAMFGLAAIVLVVRLAQIGEPIPFLVSVVFPLLWCLAAVLLVRSYWPEQNLHGFLLSTGCYLAAMLPLFPGILTEIRKAKKHISLSALSSS